MKFAGICMVTDDVTMLKEFYERVFNVEASGDDKFASFMFDETHVSIYSKAGTENLAPGSMKGSGSGNCILELEVEDVDYEYERLQSLGVKIVKQPTTQPWGIRSVWLSDPDGNIINFLCNVNK
ncbi:VOC family protein [Vallitalea okinawensis]|uniref:VOC family protein n=1 Tax=Vallitalea okinawensis TaxID=2078660 RepID=UPI000CFC1E14|nr:VOC family protein [Vallitalea okinawensis]